MGDSAAVSSPGPVVDVVSISSRKILDVGRRMSRADAPPTPRSTAVSPVASPPARCCSVGDNVPTDAEGVSAVEKLYRQDHPKVTPCPELSNGLLCLYPLFLRLH